MFDMEKLGVKQNIPKVDMLDYSGVIMAPPKFGKTEFVSRLPKTTLVAFEPGYDASVVKYIDCTSNPKNKAVGFEKFIKFIDRLEEYREEIGDDIKLIAIDTVEEMYESCEYYMLKREGLEDGVKYNAIGEVGTTVKNSKNGYIQKDKYFKHQIRRIYNLGFKILYLTHTKIKTVKPKGREPYDVYIPTIPDRCRDIVFPETSYILVGMREKIEDKLTRVFEVKGNVDNDSGSRMYLDNNIVFDTEDEAIEKLQSMWKDAVNRKLQNAGIVEDLENLKKIQNTEVMEQAREYISDVEEDLEDTLKVLRDEISIIAKTNKDKLKIIKEILAKNNIKKISEADLNVLTEIKGMMI